MSLHCPCCAPPWSARLPLGCTHRKLEADLSVPPYNDWIWDHNPQAPTSTGIMAIVTDPSDDSVYTAGRFSLTDGATLRKQDSKGILLWSATDIVNSFSTCLAMQSNGNIASGSAQITLSEHYIKLRDSSGTIVWSREGQNSSLTGALCMCFDASDNLLVGQDGSVARLEKFNSSGSYLWEYGSGLFLNRVSGVDADSNDNVYVAIATIAKSFVKLDSSGSPLWSFTHSATSSTVECVSVSPDDSKILCGGGISDIDNKVLRCLDSSGSSLWDLALYGNGTFNDRVASVCWDETGAYCYAMQQDGRYSKISSTGTLIWTARHGATGWGIHVSESGRLHVCGNLNNKTNA